MKFLFIGNPGTGKSTLLNGIIQDVKFKSGNAFGQGMTTHLQLVKDERTGYFYGDTPGLADVRLRKQAAEEITKALKSGDDDYKLIFVVTEEAGRVRPADVTTMTCVLDAISQEGSGSTPPYGIIVNKITKKKKHQLCSDPNLMDAFTTCLNNDKYVTSFIHLYEKVSDLEDEDDQVHEVTQELLTFLRSIPSIRIKPEDVSDVRIDQYEAMLEEMEQKVNALLQDKAQLEKKMEENEERLNKQLKKNEEEMDQKLQEKDRQMEHLSNELKRIKDQNSKNMVVLNAIVTIQSLRWKYHYLDASTADEGKAKPGKGNVYVTDGNPAKDWAKWIIKDVGDGMVALESVRWKWHFLDASYGDFADGKPGKGNVYVTKGHSYDEWAKWRIRYVRGTDIVRFESVRWKGHYLDASTGKVGKGHVYVTRCADEKELDVWANWKINAIDVKSSNKV